MNIYDLSKYKTLDEIWKAHDQLSSRKTVFLRHMPIGGTYREIGAHQGIGMLNALLHWKASYVDLYDVRDNGFSQLKPHLKGYNVHYTLTNGSPKINNVTPVDVTYIDAKKTGHFVYESLMVNAPLTNRAIGVDDTVSSPDILNGVSKFLKENEDWKLEFLMYTYPGLAVLVRKELVMIKRKGN